MATKVKTEEVEVIEGEVIETKVIDKNVHTLSSGVEVRFKKIPEQIFQKALADVMSGVKRDRSNNITFQQGKEIEAIQSITKYHDILVMWGVELVKPLLEVATDFELEQVELLSGNASDKMKEYYFLRYFAFNESDDFAVLTERVTSIE